MTDPEPTPKKYELKPREFERLNAEPGAQPPSAAHDVFAIRRDLREREQAAGLDDRVLGPPLSSRRKRDYWLMLVAGNLFFGAVMFLGRHELLVLFGTMAAMLSYTLALSWVMWQVMSDY